MLSLKNRLINSGAAIGSLMLAVPAMAQVQLGPVSVEDKAGYQAESADPRRVTPLRDTPQTVTVITEKLISDQNLFNLRDVLANTVPGITFTAGEGGGGYGDGITLRGYTATSDITIDGVRDSAQYTRSDPFNIQQIEVVNGANSVFSGGGSVGGGINMITKTATGSDFAVVSAGAGTGEYGRATLDAEKVLDEGISLRLNAMVHNNNAPGRDVEKFTRFGFAPSLGFGLGSPTNFTLNYFFQHDDNIPQYGQPFFFNQYNSGGLPGVDRSKYFGYENMDRQKIDTHLVTGIFNHQFTDNLSLRSLVRYARIQQDVTVNPPQGTTCLLSGINPSTGATCTALGTFIPSGPRGTERNSLNSTTYSQNDFHWNGTLLGLQHNAVAGFSFLSETFELAQGNRQRTTAGVAPTYPTMNIVNPDHVYRGPVNYFLASTQDGSRNTQAVYLFDDIKLLEQFSLNVGVRYDHNEGKNTTTAFAAPSGVGTPGAVFRNEDDLLSYRAGIVYKPVEEASFYFAYSNSKNPAQTAVNGGCNIDTCNTSPEKGANYEFGAKWNPWDGLLLTAALFRNERTNYRVPSNDPVLPAQVLNGSSHVDGIAISAAGNIMEGWDVFVNYAYLDSKVDQGVSDTCQRNPNTPNCFTATTPLAGNPLTQTPDHAFSAWTTYRILPKLNVGYGVTYQGDFYLNNGAAPLWKTGSYVTNRLMASYDITERLSLQMNINNLFDEKYFTRIRNNGWATPGDSRNVNFTAFYRF